VDLPSRCAGYEGQLAFDLVVNWDGHCCGGLGGRGSEGVYQVV